MKQNEGIIKLLENNLKQDERLIRDGILFKNKIIELALKYDEKLLDKLLEESKLKECFFIKINDFLIFNLDKFIKFISNKDFLPDSYTSFSINIGLMINQKYFSENKDVILAWPYKECILEGGQEKADEKRSEIFFNEILAPDEIDRLLDQKVLTKFKLINSHGEHKVLTFSEKDNYIIKGNNLLVLHTIKDKFNKKVKLIYIDPPFNTGNDDFNYNDKFNHSTWLTFMKNRLEIAYGFLKDDGVIFVHVDDNEHAYLKVLMDEIFETENFISTIAVRSSTPSGTKTKHKDKTIIKQKDLILCYKKKDIQIYPQYIRKEIWDSHFNYYVDKEKEIVDSFLKIVIKKGLLPENSKLSDFDIDNPVHRKFYLENAEFICQTQSHKNNELKEKSRQLKDKVLFINKGTENELMFYNGRQLTPLSNSINEVIYNGRIENDISILLCDFWSDIDFQNTQNEGGISFPSAKKPEMLLMRLLNLVTKKGDLVMDFFLGSGTTCAVAHKMGRQYIGIEQLDYGKNGAVNRLKNVINGDSSGISQIVDWKGGGGFIYFELKKSNQYFIEKIEKAKNEEEILKIWEDMKKQAFLSYRIDPKLFDTNLIEFNTLLLNQQKTLLSECLDVNNLYVNYSEIEDLQYENSKEDIELNKRFYGK